MTRVQPCRKGAKGVAAGSSLACLAALPPRTQPSALWWPPPPALLPQTSLPVHIRLMEYLLLDKLEALRGSLALALFINTVTAAAPLPFPSATG